MAHGCPLVFYSDRHGIFRVNPVLSDAEGAKDAASGDGKTAFGRVAERLDILPIHAMTPQAKGRVAKEHLECANQTLQDRLVKEMRLADVSSIEAANAYVSQFIARWNDKFAVPPCDAAPAHRPLTRTAAELDDDLAHREERTLSKARSPSGLAALYCVKASGTGTALCGAKVCLHHQLDGTMTVHCKDRILPVTAYGVYPVPDPAEDEKTINARLVAIIAQQASIVALAA